MNCRREGMQQWRDEWMVEWIKEWVSEWTNERMNGWMNHWIKGSTIQWTNGSTIQWVNKSMNHWSIESMNQGKNESMNLANFMFQKCSVPFSFANFQCKANSLKCTCCFRYSLVHILPTSSSKSVPIPAVFLRYLCETELSLSLYSLVRILPTSSSKSVSNVTGLYDLYVKSSSQSCALFADLIFQKCSGPVIFLNIFKHVSTFWSANQALATVLHFLSTTFPDPGLQLRKQREAT